MSGEFDDGALSAVVVAYHRPSELDGLLTQLRRCTAHLIVVNVDDDPAIDQVGRRHGALVLAAPNDGYAASVNLGLRHVTTEVVCFMNDDLAVEPQVLAALARAAQQEQSVVLPRILDVDGVTHALAFALATPLTLLIEWALTPDERPGWAPGWLTLEKWRPPESRMSVSAGTAAIVAAPTGLLRSFPLPEGYFLYWEELDWFWQLRTAEVDVVLLGHHTVTHGGGRGDTRPEKSALMARNAVRCVRRTQGRAAALAAWPVVVLWWLRLWLTDACRSHLDRGASTARSSGLRAAVGAWREVL